MSVYLKIPGSTANLGPGFDSIGLAINRFLYVNAEVADQWEIQFEGFPSLLPDIKENLIYQAALHACNVKHKNLPPLKVTMKNEIPLARGLGSSAAAIIAGIEVVDLLVDLQLSLKEKAHLASKIEGHPDNVTASLYGGLTISSHFPELTETVTCPAPKIEMVAMIPQFELKTNDARSILPESLSFQKAIKGSSVSNVLVAAIVQENWELAGKLMEKDVFHQPYRTNLIPDLATITEFGRSLGVLGTALSGAGPTVISFVRKDEGVKVAQQLSHAFPNYQCEILLPVEAGVMPCVFHS